MSKFISKHALDCRGHLSLRLLIGLPKLARVEQNIVFDLFSAIGLLIHGATHHQTSSIDVLSSIARIKLNEHATKERITFSKRLR